MFYSINQATADDKACQQVTFGALQHVLPQDQILHVLAQTQSFEVRERRLNMACVLYLLMARAFHPKRGLDWIACQIWDEIRFLFSDPTDPTVQAPTSAAFTYRRKQLGVKALHTLFQNVCKPLAQLDDPGCFAFGYRLMAIDSTVKTMRDTPANEHFFGRSAGHKGTSAFPQVRATFLVECGTHAIVDAVFHPCRPCEQKAVPRLFRSFTSDMLVLLDSGFFSYSLLFRLLEAGVHLLLRLPAHVQPVMQTILPDGSALVLISPSSPVWKRQARPLLMRMIAYEVPSENDPSVMEHRRVLTSLLDPEQAPLLEVILCYHDRWEIELAIKELFLRYPFLHARFSSTTPAGVLQEFYGLLLGHYATRSLMLQAARKAEVPVKQVSYSHTVHVITLSLPRFQRSEPDAWPLLLTILFFDILQNEVPHRPLRRNPRCVKRRLSPFPSKNTRLKKAVTKSPPKPSQKKRKARLKKVAQERPPTSFLETMRLLPYTAEVDPVLLI